MPRILVVDDDPMVGATIEVLLQRQGFEVTLADGGETGLAALEAQPFDVMLVDIFMPHMRGFQSIRIFHERAPAIPSDRDVRLRFCVVLPRPPPIFSAWRWNSARRDACASRSRQTPC